MTRLGIGKIGVFVLFITFVNVFIRLFLMEEQSKQDGNARPFREEEQIRETEQEDLWRQGYIFHAREIPDAEIIRISGMLSLLSDAFSLAQACIDKGMVEGTYPKRCDNSFRLSVKFHNAGSCTWCSFNTTPVICYNGTSKGSTFRNKIYGPTEYEFVVAKTRNISTSYWKPFKYYDELRGQTYYTGTGDVALRCEFPRKYSEILYQQGVVNFQCLNLSNGIRVSPSPRIKPKSLNVVQCKKMIFGDSKANFNALQARFHNQVWNVSKTITYIAGFESPTYSRQ